MSIRLRKQRHLGSCGLACVSMVANKPYNTVIQDFVDFKGGNVGWTWNPRTESSHLRYNTKEIDLHHMLDRYGIRLNRRWSLYRGRKTLPDLSILAVDYSDRGWHWVVAEKQPRRVRVLDPWEGEMTLRECQKVHASLTVHT